MNKFIVKNKKVIIIGASMLVVGVIVFLLIRKKRKTDYSGSETEVSTAVIYPIKVKAGELTSAAEKEVIRNIQKYLNSKATYVELPLTVDGIYGVKTEAKAQRILGVKTISYSLYKEILSKI